jgi:hypothetical protein
MEMVSLKTPIYIVFGESCANVGGVRYELRTANKYPHTYFFARPRAKLRDESNHEHNIPRYTAIYESYSNTFFTQVGFVVLANMFP